MNIFKVPVLIWGVLLVWTGLYFCGIFLYSGSTLMFNVFSFVYLALLLSGICYKVTYGYMFFVIMLWLGFWLKIVVHLLSGSAFVEPIGYFDSSESSWDNVLLVASIGALGVISGRVIFHILFGLHSTMTNNTEYSPPNWYSQHKLVIWLLFIFCVVVFSVLNSIYSFQQVGIVPKTIIWPLNTVFYWLLTTGFTMTAVTLMWWEFVSGKNKNTIYFVVFESAMSSVSLLSRGVYIFNLVPVLAAVFLNRKKIYGFSYRWFLFLFFVFILVFCVCYPLVNAARDYYYSSVPFAMPVSLYSGGVFQKFFLKMTTFSVDRWVGVEGLMATSAYPEKGISLFFSVLTEKGEIGKLSIFQDIALSHYRYLDTSRFSFASLPGPISFYYLSGSLLVVMFGMALMALLILMSEVLVYRMLRNPLLAAFWGGGCLRRSVRWVLIFMGLFCILFCALLGFCFCI
ncbi:hypothetical protein [Pseudomonas gingeri]|uniref:hypothetical protein n=1 Tax=Pseudomonas gingeri TaxID=117681 RepID=UPI0015A48F85|nr:hypothetical protein [Pseudomonas gingeri]NWE45764.1 hypothetical protein [Pseudomonas gingeri]